MYLFFSRSSSLHGCICSICILIVIAYLDRGHTRIVYVAFNEDTKCVLNSCAFLSSKTMSYDNDDPGSFDLPSIRY